jgi:hypothetical protein
MRYDYFVGGRWRNRDEIRKVIDALDAAGKTSYCFINNSWNDAKFSIEAENSNQADIETFMHSLETLDDWRTNPTFRAIYEKDMNGIRDAIETVIVFPAGLSAHMELGAAFGMGKRCYGIGPVEKHETLYLMFDEMYPDIDAFVEARLGVKV